MFKRLVFASVVLFGAACSNSSVPAASNPATRKAGWTDAVYNASISSCEETVVNSLQNSSKAPAVCTCWTNYLSTTYTTSDLDKDDTKIETDTENKLSACAQSQAGEQIQFRALFQNYRRFLRVPLSEPTKAQPPKSVRNALDKLKKKQAEHAGQAGANAAGANRPDAVSTEKPEAKGKAVFKITEFLPKEDAQTKKIVFEHSDSRRNVDFQEINCDLLIDTKNDQEALILEFQNLKGDNRDRFSFTVADYDKTQLHYSMDGTSVVTVAPVQGDLLKATYTRGVKQTNEATFIAVDELKTGVKSHTQITNLKIKNGVATGTISFERYRSYTEKAKEKLRKKEPLAPGDIVFMNAIGDFSCPVTDGRSE